MDWKIKKDVLLSIMEISKKTFPNEFSGLLYGDLKTKILTDLYILPATQNYNNLTILRTDLAPMIFNLIGSVHSHPSGFGKPSKADLHFFSTKAINIITYSPFRDNDFIAYDRIGQSVLVKII